MIRYYRHSGVQVSSAIALPEWAQFRDRGHSAEEADVTIALTERPLAPTGMPDGAVVVQQRNIRFDVEGVGRWLVSQGRHIVVDPHTTGGARELRLFTIGTAWGVLGYQRGWLMCHGSVVVPSGATRAILLTGASGQGKSTTAAALVAAGGTLLADDLCRVENRLEGGPAAHPSAGYLKLWRDGVEALGWSARIAARDHYRADKFLCDLPPEARAGAAPVPLDAIVVLAWGETLSLQRIRGSEAFAAVISAACYRPQALDALGAWQGQTEAWLTLLQHTPVFRLQRPKDFAQISAASRLLEHLHVVS